MTAHRRYPKVWRRKCVGSNAFDVFTVLMDPLVFVYSLYFSCMMQPHERGHMHPTYLKYKDMKKSIRLFAIIEIQRVLRGCMSRVRCRRLGYTRKNNEMSSTPAVAKNLSTKILIANNVSPINTGVQQMSAAPAAVSKFSDAPPVPLVIQENGFTILGMEQ